jgi:hypothetical protein
MTQDSPSSTPTLYSSSRRPNWRVAWIILSIYGVYQFFSYGPDTTFAFRVGSATAAIGIAAIVSLGATKLWRRQYTPSACATLAALLLATASYSLHKKINQAKDDYTLSISRTMRTWRNKAQTWNASGGCDPAAISSIDVLDRNIAAAIDLRDHSRTLLSELESGELFFSTLSASSIQRQKAKTAWSEIQELHGIKVVTRSTRAAVLLTEAALVYLTEMKSIFGQWEVEASGQLVFDYKVDDLIIERINDAAEVMAANAAIIESLSEPKQQPSSAR